MMPRTIFLFSLFLGLMLSGCEATKEELGLTRRSPDEFAIMKRAPLEVPSDLDNLPAPHPGARRPQETPAITNAKAAVMGDDGLTTSTSDAPSAAENVLLQKTGAGKTPSNIRDTVDREAVESAKDNRSTVKKILSIGKKDDDGPSAVVDAPAELKRLQSKNTGETPSVDE